MSFRHRLEALEAIARQRPVTCTTCGRGHQHDPGVVVVREGEVLSRCSACGGCLSPAGEPVGQVVDGKPEVMLIRLLPGDGAMVEPPRPKPSSGEVTS